MPPAPFFNEKIFTFTYLILASDSERPLRTPGGGSGRHGLLLCVGLTTLGHDLENWGVVVKMVSCRALCYGSADGFDCR